MKRFVLLAGALLAFGGCEDVHLEPRFKLVPRIGSEPEDPAAKARAAAEEVQRDLEAHLRELQGELDRLASQTGDAKRATDDQLKELRERKDELERALGDAKREGEQALRQLQRTLESIERDVKQLGSR